MIDIANPHLTVPERAALEELLARLPNNPPTLEDVWQLMDEVWDELGCDDTKPNAENIATFYAHPIWTLNGLFIEQHPTSLQHRSAIVQWITSRSDEISQVADYGGGFGSLARMIAAAQDSLHIDVVDPYPSAMAIARARDFPNVHYVDQLAHDYDCIVCTDVLEHVPDPLVLLADMRNAVRIGGYLLIANHFSPSIKCHLPSTFHFRLTFSLFARLMRLAPLGPCEGSHALIFKKKDAHPIPWRLIRNLEQLSRISGPPLKVAFWLKKRWKHLRK